MSQVFVTTPNSRSEDHQAPTEYLGLSQDKRVDHDNDISPPVLVFVIIGYRAGGNVIDSQEGKLLNVARIVATAFPYIFALIFGRMLRSALARSLKKGVDCLSFAYLSRSCTFGGAYTTPFQIRCRHWLPSLLLVPGAFSPLESQA
ncbi:hypothetical protein K458DRAFT_386271 [Lentithecium fluviatile CBS 122367]|uniref:Uncharacterized protein n=1 Tax=Lentithecium fluviatile CBS 122367 TaxID=1168545 RepID=A0A6G1JBD9_9PLEO|nr:hypothetical protein K458DRAFT_386271 [Lentithecium fluviatile CBS 122367]